jgi:hypothetical protein
MTPLYLAIARVDADEEARSRGTDRGPFGPEQSARVIYSPQAKGFRKEESTMREDQSVAEMANEVLMRQAKARAERRGEPIEEAMEAVLGTEAGKQLMELRDGPHGEEGVEETQVDAARERAKERAEELGRRLGETPGHPEHG